MASKRVPISLAPARPDRLSEQVSDSIRQAILAGDLKPGDRLVEGALAESLQVSKSPVREAIRELAREGLVSNTKRRGTFVRGMTAEDAREIRVLRVTLETLAVTLAMEQPQSAWLDEMEACIRQLKRAKDRTELGALHAEFHDILTSRSGNRRLSEILAGLRIQRAVLLPFVDLFSGDAELEAHEHQQILDAVKSGERQQVERVLHRHISESGELIEATWTEGSQPA